MKKQKYDVLVAGGGPAGVAAAVAAAREGAHVLLVERENGLGGNVRAAHVHSICGLYHISETNRAVPLNGGIAMEFVSLLGSVGGACGPCRFGKLDVLLQEPEKFSAVCGKLAEESPSLEVALDTVISGVEATAKNLDTATLMTSSGSVVVHATAFIDCTGDANLGALAGAACDLAEPDKLQRPAFIFAVGSVDPNLLETEQRLALSASILAAVRSGRLPQDLLGVVMRPTCHSGVVRFTLDLAAGGARYNPLDDVQIKGLTAQAKSLANQLVEFLASTHAGFAGASLREHGERIGIRESRRVVGRSTVTAEDVISGFQPHDTVVLSSWPLEWHESGQAMRMVFPNDDKACGVPLSALRSREWGNLFMAGRCMSATHEAEASLRVIGSTLASGQAAGLAASSLADNFEPHVATIRSACAA
ncbi:MAG: FAD-dependent oxidoreductase [Sphaerospermopsis kisseleviana]